MINVEKLYTIKLTEEQAQELYEFLRGAKDVGHLSVDRDLILVYNELKNLFDTGMYKGLTGEYVAFVEGGYTICAQPDREKADRCLEYYKSQHPTAITYGTWEND